MIEQVIKNTQETFEITFYKDNVATAPSSVYVDVEKLSGVTVVSGTTVLSSGAGTAGTPCSYILTSQYTTALGQYRIVWKPIISGELREDTQYFEVVTKKTTYTSNRTVLETIGDMPLPDGIDLSRYIKKAEAVVNSALHGIYVTPVDISTDAISQEAIDMLDNITGDLATGYLLRSLGAAQQVKELNSYAKELIDGAKTDLEKITKQEVILTGAVLDTNKSDDKVRFANVVVSSPDGASSAKDSKSYFNRPYDEIADSTYEVDIDL